MRNWKLCKDGSQPEWIEQSVVANYLRTKYRDSILWTAAASGLRSFWSAVVRMKMAGLNRGVPDLLIFEPRGNRVGLAIEMKRKTGGQLSPEQKWWLSELEKRNWVAVVCNGADEAIAEIEKYLEQK
jgi:hypothetical protein